MSELSVDCSICYLKSKYCSMACPNCNVCFDCFFETNKNKLKFSSCPDCLDQINLIYLFLYLGKKYHFNSIDVFYQIARLTEEHNLKSILFDISQEALQTFSKYNFIVCIHCNGKNVTAFIDLQVYKCGDCQKVYCPTCDISEMPAKTHKCDCSIGRCPKCHIFIDKIEGCNHITCPICSCEFVYRSNTFVTNFYVDSALMFNKVPTIEPTATFEDIAVLVAQFPLQMLKYGSIKKLLMIND